MNTTEMESKHTGVLFNEMHEMQLRRVRPLVVFSSLPQQTSMESLRR